MAPLIAFIPMIAAGIGAVTAGVELTNQPKAPVAPTVQANNAQAAQAEQAAALAQAHALTSRRGMASTVLTSPMGAPGGGTVTNTLGT